MKKLAVGVGIVLALLIALVAVALLTIHPDELINSQKGKLAKAVSQTLGREVRLGRVESHFFPTFGAVIRDVAIEGPGDGAPDQMKFDALEVRIALLKALFTLGRSLEVRAVIVRGLEAKVARDASGIWDFQDILDHLASGPPSGGTAEAPPEDLTFLEGARLSRVAVEDAKVEIDDATLGRPLRVRGLTFALEDIRLGAPISVTLQATLEDGSKSTPVLLNARLAELRRDLSFDPLPDLSASMKIDGLDLGPWGGLLPKSALAPAAGTLDADITAEATGDLSRLIAKGRLDLDKLVLRQAGQLGKPVTLHIGVDASLNRDEPRYRVDSIVVKGTGIDLKGKLDAHGFTPAGLKKADLSLTVEELTRLVAAIPSGSPLLPEELGLNGPIQAHLRGSLESIDLSVNLDRAHVRWADQFDKQAGRALNLQLKGTKQGERFEIPELALVVDQARIKGSLGFGANPGDPITADLTSGPVELSSLRELLPPIAKALKRGDKVKGTLEVAASAKASHGSQEAQARVSLSSLDVNLASLQAQGSGLIEAKVVPTASSTTIAVTGDLSRLAFSSVGDGGERVLDKPTGMPFDVDLQLTQSAKRADVKKAKLRIGKTTISATGNATGMDGSSPRVDLDFGRLDVAFDDVRRCVPGASSLPPGGSLKGALKVEGNPRDSASLIAKAKIERLRYGDTSVTGNLSVANLDRPKFTMDLQSPRLDIDKLLGEDDEPATKGTKSGAADDNPHGLSASTRETLSRVNGEGSLRVGQARFKGMEFANFKGVFKMVDGVVTFSALDFDTYDGHVSGAGSRFDLPAERTGYALKLQADKIDLGMALSDHTKVGHLFAGSTDDTVDVTGRGLSKEGLVQSLSGPVNLNCSALTIKSLDLLGAIGRPLKAALAKVGQKQFKGFDASGEGTTLKGVKAWLKFNQGRFELKKPLRTRTGFGELELAGGGALDNTIDLTGTAFLAPQTLNRAIGTNAVKKPVPIPLKIGGTWSQPRITGVDVEPLVRSLLGEQVGQVVDRAQEKIDEVKEGAKKRAEAEAKRATDRARREADAAKKKAEAEARARSDQAKAEVERQRREAEARARAEAEKRKKEAERRARAEAEKRKKKAAEKAKKLLGL